MLLFKLSITKSTIVTNATVPEFTRKKKMHPLGLSFRQIREEWTRAVFSLCELYRRFPGVHCGAREITALSMERTDVSQISRSSSVPTCRVRVSENLEGELSMACQPRSVWR